MRADEDNWRVIYINGEKRHATRSRDHDTPDFSGKFFVDTPELPYRRCSQHYLRPDSAAHLEGGGRVFTSGIWYSLHPGETP